MVWQLGIRYGNKDSAGFLQSKLRVFQVFGETLRALSA